MRLVAKSYVYNQENQLIAYLRTHAYSGEWHLVVHILGVEPVLGPEDVVFFWQYSAEDAWMVHAMAGEGLKPAGGRVVMWI